MKKDHENILTADVKEIIYHKPSWIIRNGLSVFFLLLFALSVGSWFLKTSDFFYANANLFCGDSLSNSMKRTEGRILVSKEDISKIRKGQTVKFMSGIVQAPKISYLPGQVTQIIDYQNTDSYLVIVSFSDSVKTCATMKLMCTTSSTIKAEITLGQKRLFNELFNLGF